MIQKGSQGARAVNAGGLSGLSCTCMKITPQSGQAWRGYERALSTFIASTNPMDYNVDLVEGMYERESDE